jgi:hypothetical protein
MDTHSRTENFRIDFFFEATIDDLYAEIRNLIQSPIGDILNS